MKIKGPTEAREETKKDSPAKKSSILQLLQQSFRFRDASFFVSPARHGEAQDMSGT
jgi:hypothetical protein